jgi:hypothetical protein
MENSRYEPPRSRHALTTLHLLLLSTIVAFGVWFGGGWLLGRQLTVPDDAETPLQYDDQLLVRVPSVGAGTTDDGYLLRFWEPA